MLVKNEGTIKSLGADIAALSKNSRYSSGLHLINTALVLNKQLDQILGRFNLNGPRVRVLFILILHGGTIKARDLTKPLLLTRQGTSKILYSLLKSGLVSKRVDTADRRSFNISITKKGLDSTRACLPMLSKFSDITMGELSEDDTKILNRLTKNIRESVHKVSL